MTHAVEIVEGFTKLYAKSDRNKQRSFNRALKKHTFMVVHPYRDKLTEEPTLLIGFTDTDTVLPVDENMEIGPNCRTIFHTLSYIEHITGYEKANELTETLVIPTTDLTPFDHEVFTWDQVLELPEIEKGKRDILRVGMVEFYGYQHDYKREEHANQYFFKEEDIPGVELKTVWKDIDSGYKYGTISTLIIWEGKLIGHVSCHGKWLDTYTYYAHDANVWKDFMKFLHDRVVEEFGEFMSEEFPTYNIIDPSDSAEEWIGIAGVSTPDYGE